MVDGEKGHRTVGAMHCKSGCRMLPCESGQSSKAELPNAVSLAKVTVMLLYRYVFTERQQQIDEDEGQDLGAGWHICKTSILCSVVLLAVVQYSTVQ